jgi:hypothetical protein
MAARKSRNKQAWLSVSPLLPINKDIVRRVLTKRYKPGSDCRPSRLASFRQMKNSLWSLDLFRCGSATLHADRQENSEGEMERTELR